MGNNSLIKLDQLISAFAASHEQIKRYYFEAEDNMSIVTTADQSFPVLYATLVPGSSLGFNQNIFNIRFYCFDIIEKGRENWLTINSDCHLILNDLYRFLVDGNYPFDVQDTDPVPVEWVNDGTLDYVAGLYIDLQIYADTYSDCYIPLDGAVIFSGETGQFVPQEFLTCETVTACTELQNYVSNAIASGSTLENDFYMMLNFKDVEQFEYRVPEQFAVLNLENPLGLTATLKVNGSAYTTGTTISQYALFTVDVNTAGYIKLNCQKV